MKYLIFDVETTGLPKNYKAELDDFDNWPRIVQIAWMLIDKHGVTSRVSFIIKPDGYVIPEEVSELHGVTQERAESGFFMDHVLYDFAEAVHSAHVLVGHNVMFDRNIVGSELLRAGMEDVLHGMPKCCTMMKSTKFCKIPNENRGGYKWPKLEELYLHLFEKPMSGAHDAFFDVEATRKCFVELLHLGVMDIQYLIDKLEKAIGFEVHNQKALEEQVNILKSVQESKAD